MNLIAGQIVRYEHKLWRVDYVNSCRAYIVPLGKVKIHTEGGGTSISPDSPLPIVTDIARAREEMEIEETERELAELRVAMATPEKPAKATAAPRLATLGVPAQRGGGWRVGPAPAPAFRSGSLAAEVMAMIVATPGITTKQIVAGVKAEGAAAACVSRFNQATYIIKS